LCVFAFDQIEKGSEEEQEERCICLDVQGSSSSSPAS
jgi:hypothetical protein